MARKRVTKANAHKQPIGLTYDVLHEIRRAMRILRQAEKWIVTAHRAEKRRLKAQSDEWKESQRITELSRMRDLPSEEE